MTDHLRTLERDSIRAFVQQAADDGYIKGVVLDYGCGKQPYRDIIESIKPFGGPQYQAFDQEDFPANVSGENIGEGDPLYMGGWGTILCTQVIQYIPPEQLYGDDSGDYGLFAAMRGALREDGHLVLTYPTNWPEVEPEDLHRFTKAGMERLLTEAGFEIVRHERRASIRSAGPRTTTGPWIGDEFALGYGVICRA